MEMAKQMLASAKADLDLEKHSPTIQIEVKLILSCQMARRTPRQSRQCDLRFVESAGLICSGGCVQKNDPERSVAQGIPDLTRSTGHAPNGRSPATVGQKRGKFVTPI
jgi:hypothetical protein